MIRSFRDRTAEDLFTGADSASIRRMPPELRTGAKRKLIVLAAAMDLRDLAVPPGNHLEQLKGRNTGLHSIRINDQWRLVFRWTERGAEDVEIVDYH